MAARNSASILFDKTGKFIKQFGKKGTGLDGEFDQPHSLAFDSKGRLFVADRANNRIQILDAETFKTLDTWYQFSRLSGIFIQGRHHLRRRLGVGLGEPAPRHVEARHPHRQRQGRQGDGVHSRSDERGRDVRDGGWQAGDEEGRRLAGPTGTLAAEGVVVDKDGIIYGAEVGPHKLQRYVKKK